MRNLPLYKEPGQGTCTGARVWAGRVRNIGNERAPGGPDLILGSRPSSARGISSRRFIGAAVGGGQPSSCARRHAAISRGTAIRFIR